MRTWLFLFGGAVAAISLSCGIKNAFYDSGEGEKPVLQDPHQQVGVDLSQDGNLVQPPAGGAEVGEVDEAKDRGADRREEQKPQPLEPPPKGDFTRTDANGVIITKEGGMQKTIMPSGEVYYLPDEFK